MQLCYNQTTATRNFCAPERVIIPHMKIVSRDWLTKVGHSIMSTGKMSTGKTSTVLTGSTGSHCCFHRYFTKLGFVWYNKTNMPCQCGYPDGMSPRGRMVFPRAEPKGKPSSFHQDTHTGMAYLYIDCAPGISGIRVVQTEELLSPPPLPPNLDYC